MTSLHGQSEPSALPGSMDRESLTAQSRDSLPAAGCMHWQGMYSLPTSVHYKHYGQQGNNKCYNKCRGKRKAKFNGSAKFLNRMVAVNPISPKSVSNLTISPFSLYVIYIHLDNWLWSHLRDMQGRRYNILVTNLKYFYFSWAVEGKVLRSLLMETITHHHWPLREYAFLWSLNQDHFSYQKKEIYFLLLSHRTVQGMLPADFKWEAL